MWSSPITLYLLPPPLPQSHYSPDLMPTAYLHSHQCLMHSHHCLMHSHRCLLHYHHCLVHSHRCLVHSHRYLLHSHHCTVRSSLVHSVLLSTTQSTSGAALLSFVWCSISRRLCLCFCSDEHFSRRVYIVQLWPLTAPAVVVYVPMCSGFQT